MTSTGSSLATPMRSEDGVKSPFLVQCAVAFHILVYFLNLDVLAYAVDSRILPLYAHVVSAALSLAVVLRTKIASRMTREAMLWWIFCFVVLVIVWSVPVSPYYEKFEYLRYVQYTVSGVVAPLIVFSALNRADIGWLRYLLLAVFFIAVMSIVADYVFPFRVLLGIAGVVDDAQTYYVDRAAGVFVNPNAAAMALTMFVFCVGIFWRSSTALFLVLVFAVAVVITFSRAGLVFFVLAVIALSLLRRLPASLLLLGPATIVGLVVFLLFFQLVDSENSLSRLLFFASTDSAVAVRQDERFSLAVSAVRQIAQSPVFGYGWGFSKFWGDYIQSQGTHNMFLSGALDFGAIGWLIWPSWCAAWFYSARGGALWRAAVVLTLILYGFFTHNALESHLFLVPAMFLLACGGLNSPRQSA